MRVIFAYAEHTNGHIAYPDAIEMFANTDLFTVPGHIIADYAGALTLTPYLPPKLVVTAVVSDNEADTVIDLANAEITCPIGTTLTITAELRNALMPVTAAFNMPTQQDGGRRGMLKANMVDSVATVRAAFAGPSDDGKWTASAADINSNLPPTMQMAFDGLTVNVHR